MPPNASVCARCWARDCRTRSRKTRNELVQEYIYIAEITARRFSGRGVEYDDLYQIASLALINALERYDTNRGVEFATYAQLRQSSAR